MADVPCGVCIRCCITPCERPFAANRADGSCIHSTPAGCAIYSTRPQECRDFDCREFSRTISFTIARRAGLTIVFQKGRQLTKQASRSLPSEESER